MALPSVFDKSTAAALVKRIEQLTPQTKPLWGTMTADRMLAHCNVTYEMTYTDKHPRPGFLMRLMLKWFVKNTVVSEKPYKKNERTAPAFIIGEDKNFEVEKKRLIEYIWKTQELGSAYFEGKESLSFGKMTATEWNNQFYKHLDHHFRQFGL